MAKTSEIKFVPVCSNCRRELRTIIDYSIDYSDGIMVNHIIQPYQCPVCKAIFTAITIPCRLPVDNRVPDPPMRISKDLIQYPEPKEDVYIAEYEDVNGMTDREKLIKAIEKAKKQSKEYAQDCIIVPFKEADMILTLLKEEAEEVVEEERRVLWDETDDEPVYTHDVFYHCPSCNLILSRTHKDKDINFCQNCGKAVKWDE